MKKLLTILLALTMVFSMAAVSFADTNTEHTDMSTVTITKNYEATNTGTTSPAETFKFTIENTSVTDAATGVTKENMPTPTISNVQYTAGDAGKDNAKSKEIIVTLPTNYTSVGIYTYTIKEAAGDTAGVTYRNEPITLKVTVIQQNSKLVRIARVYAGENGAKSSGITNTYSAGSLEVTKEVTGLLGDTSKEFDVTVTFTAPIGKTVGEAISYRDGDADKTIATTDWKDGEAKAVITLKHDETVTFTNVPYGVTYKVVENDYTGSDKYETPTYVYSDENNKKIDTLQDTVKITNNKNGNIDTGLILNNGIYVAILAIVLAAVAAFVIRRRKFDA